MLKVKKYPPTLTPISWVDGQGKIIGEVEIKVKVERGSFSPQP